MWIRIGWFQCGSVSRIFRIWIPGFDIYKNFSKNILFFKSRIAIHFTLDFHHRLNMEISKVFLGSISLDVHSCTHWMRPRNPPPPCIWTRITRALLVRKDRRYLFVTPWPPWWTSSGGRSLEHAKDKIQHFKTWICLYFYGQFALLDPHS